MSEMIERVARRMARLTTEPGDTVDHVKWMVLAREAIEAMREPTEAMINNPLARCYNTGQFADKEVRRIYSSMIDEALK